MRLNKIKLAGFKSFVDPTVVNFPTDITGVVGPNGCGKSNIIDAVRLVMGETSRHLRGGSMEDVIFNGSSSRKPVGQASAELVFDNSDQSLGGRFAAYNEISLRRVVSRDGSSNYYLNGTRCRRKDIVDIFLGTGLGPNSYAIIEQGMISRLVDAKPHELKVYLEEAAGVSKYKERRRETESRIAQTRENLGRLQDVLGELEKQIDRLKRQARSAERFQELRQQQKQLKVELLALRFRATLDQLNSKNERRGACTLDLESLLEQQKATETGLDILRTTREHASQSVSEAQAEQYRHSAETARCEQDIQSLEQGMRTLEDELKNLQAAANSAVSDQTAEARKIQEAETSLSQSRPALHESRQADQAGQAALLESEQALSAWQNQWLEISRSLEEKRRTAALSDAERGHLVKELGGIEERLGAKTAECGAIDTRELDHQLATLGLQQTESQSTLNALEEQFAHVSTTLSANREQLKSVNEALDMSRRERSDLSGKLTSLKTLQESVLRRDGKAVSAWLADAGLAEAPRLAEALEADPEWAFAVEVVLNERLQALGVVSLDELAARGLPAAEILFVETGIAESSVALHDDGLLQKLRSQWDLRDLTFGVRTAQDAAEALARRVNLREGESIVTADGLWVGRNWIRCANRDNPYTGVIAREQQIRELDATLKALHAQVESLQVESRSLDSRVLEAERERDRIRQTRDELMRDLARQTSRLTETRMRLLQMQERKTRLDDEIVQLSQRKQNLSGALHEIERSRAMLMAVLNDEEAASTRSAQQRISLNEALVSCREQARSQSQAAQALQLRVQHLEATISASKAAAKRLEERAGDVSARLDKNSGELTLAQQKVVDLRDVLKERKTAKADAEFVLQEARREIDQAEKALRSEDERRQTLMRSVDAAREALDQARMDWQETNARSDAMQEQFTELSVDAEQAVQALADDANAESWGEQLADVDVRISRLGPINLAAIEEHQEVSERKDYLDAQHADLNEALTTLESAMSQIDEETRSRFDATFSQVNVKLDEAFKRLFGGGGARLEAVGEESEAGLKSGVALIAKPPGKRANSIHLLSGGEKALTAVALVFAIFALNPAPFCLLDEVDAPLDEANVGRFCELVKFMSQNVQFIIVTHNKTTMEYAYQLQGVTMQEPGVSRLVAVDIDQAAQMAATG